MILFAHRVNPQFPLILAANRDEFHARPTAEAHFWPSESGDRLLAGKDLEAGGTWLGISDSGRFAAVTNIRNPAQPAGKPRSRGELPTGFLNSGASSSLSAEDYCQQVLTQADDYAGFNLLVGDGDQLCYLNNRDKQVQVLEPGIYGLSNSVLNSDWPKVNRGKQRLHELLAAEGFSNDELLALVADRSLAADDQLPETGVPKAMEKTLSAMFILNEELNYGTRCSSALIMGRSGDFRFSERNFDNTGTLTSHHHFDNTVSKNKETLVA